MVSAQTPATSDFVLSDEQKRARTSKKWWQVGLTFVCWQVIALLVCELVLFGAGIGEEEIFKFDRVLGFRHFPNKIVTWRSEGFARSYFDSDGMREPGLTIVKPANTLRVALLGDSLVESLQVPIDQSYGKLIEKNIGTVDGKAIQVVNFGNSGYSTTQDCLLLEEKVFKYQPDLVILGYSSRDMMENWSPPDETLSNVRPAALKLPGHELIIDNTPVTLWLQSPRARFLQSIDWFRHHSRVWGIISATELQLSMKDPLMKSLLNFCTNPVRSSRATIRTFNGFIRNLTHPGKNELKTAPEPVVATPDKMVDQNGEANKISTGSQKEMKTGQIELTPQIKANIEAAPPAVVVANIPVTNTMALPSVAVPAADEDPGERSQYTKLIAATMGGLIGRMNEDCREHHAKFLVVGMPCRTDLSPYSGFQTAPELTFSEELKIVKKGCNAADVTFFDANSPARPFAASAKKSLFFSAHLAPAGHVYASELLMPVVRSALGNKK